MDTFDDPLLKRELKDMWNDLNSRPKYAGKLANPFFGYARPTFAKSKTRVLYIGKATAGPLDKPDLSVYFGCNPGAFWSFAQRLSRISGEPADPLANIAWSNLCKIGTRTNNPGKSLAAEQQKLAVTILKAEIQYLEPSLIVCVAGYTIYDDFFYQALKTTRGHDGFIGRPRKNPTMWVRTTQPPYPPILWMRHPQTSSREYLNFAYAEAMRLLALNPRV
jgi:hypothetical protein